MLTSFQVQNFRCFKDLRVEPLKRINLVAGKNNVGKTALLEVLWLQHGADNPELPLRLQLFRGVFGGAPGAVFENLFRNFDTEQAIRLVSSGDWGDRDRQLVITWQEAPVTTETLASTAESEQVVVAQAGTSTELTPFGKEIVFSHVDELGRSFISKGQLVSRPVQTQLGPGIGTAFQKEVAKIPKRPTGRLLYPYFLGNINAEADIVTRYSGLAANKQEGKLLDVVKVLEPRLRGLTSITQEGYTSLWGDIGLAKLVPVSLMGGGTARILSIVLAIASSPGGLVLIDEMENGFHHSMLQKVWRDVATFAREYKVQIIATTHSYETVKGAYEAFAAEEADDFRLLRLDRTDDEIRAVSYDLETLGAAIETGLEVR